MESKLSRTWFRFVVPVLSLTFFIGAALHAGITLAGFDEPTIVPATIVESLCGAALAFSSYAVFSNKAWWRTATMASHGLALFGVLVGVFALAVGAGPRTELNSVYHVAMICLLCAGLLIASSSKTEGAGPVRRADVGNF
jgi:hypothetical protein